MTACTDVDLLDAALDSLLGCPLCGGGAGRTAEGIRCRACGRAYPLRDGVLDCLVTEPLSQEEERRARDAFASRIGPGEDLLEVVGRHHCIPVMRGRARAFHARFAERDWILDLGVGYGWHWEGVSKGAGIVGVDFSRLSLEVANVCCGRAAPGCC